MPFELLPYTNFHDLNLDWIMSQFPKVYEARDEAEAAAAGMEAIKDAAENARDAAQTAQGMAEAAQLAAEAAQGYAEDAASRAAQSVEDAGDIVEHALDDIGTGTAGAVADWLSENVDPSTGYVVDKSLTISGAAADARATGLSVGGLRDFWKDVYTVLEWEQGDINLGTGAEETSSSAVRSGFVAIPSAIPVLVTGINEDDSPNPPPEISVAMAVYSSDDVSDFVSSSGPVTENAGFFGEAGYYVRFIVKYTGGGSIDPTATVLNFVTVDVREPTDTNLSLATSTTGNAADSGAVGDAIRALYNAIPLLDTTLSIANRAADAAATGAAIDEVKSTFNDMVEDTMNVTPTASYYDFSDYIGGPLFGTNGMFSGVGGSFDMDVSGLNIAGETISTFVWIDALSTYITGNITEVQLDADGQQIFPSSGTHYMGNPMTILPDCATIRLWAGPNAYNAWANATITHAQLYNNGLTQVGYAVEYSVAGMVTTDELNDVKTSIDFDYVVTSNNQIDPSGAIGKTFGDVNDTIYKFPFGKTLEDIGKGFTNFIVYLNTGSISGYYQLIKEDGTTDNGNYSFNTSTIGIAALTNTNLIRGIKIHAYVAGQSTVIASFGMTFNGAALDTFATGVKSNVNPASWTGKKWVSYGDSITQGGHWQPFVIKRTGLTLVNAGLGSSCVADASGSSEASFTNSDRIAALPTDADVITIMGGTNDYGYDVPLGNIPTSDPYDKTTFIGALCETVRLIQTQCPNALLIIMSNVGGRGTTGQARTIPPRNNIGLASSDYALAAEQVADFMGTPFIDVHRCGITPMNRVLYMSDSVHPNVEGAKLIARKVIDYITNNYPI